MAIFPEEINAVTAAYLIEYPNEAERLAPLLGAIKPVGIRSGALPHRKTLPGHVTTGALLLDDEGRLLQIAHKALGRWLNPGGHCESQDTSLPEAALRELVEETGIPAHAIELLAQPGGLPIDIDIHPIPANPAKDEPGHWHYDFRYVFRLTGSSAVDLQEDEVDGHRWIPASDIEAGQLAEKLAVVRGRRTGPVIKLVLGDITTQDADAIVNAANSSLLGGGGVDGAIHRKGGPEILDACRALRASHYGKGLATGQAVPTTAGRLPARWVIHTVGPVHANDGNDGNDYAKDQQEYEKRAALLAACHVNALRVADELGAATVAFPAISTGVFGWPLADAARIALATAAAARTDVTEVRFVLFNAEAYDVFAAALAQS